MIRILDNHLKNLDSVPMLPETIFRDQTNKERYETLLTYSYRKYEAADYHFRNVGRFIAEEISELDSNRLPQVLDPKIAEEMTYQFTENVDKYVFELSAFLEALKSSVDLISEVCSTYLVGVEVNYSIKPLMKLVEKGQRGPILDEISKNLEWLKSLRDYRHHLVHRLMPSVQGGYEIRRIKNQNVRIRYPVIVPESTPSFVIDTRTSRTMVSTNDGPPGLDFEQSVVKRQKPDGSEEILSFSFEARASSGYKPIEQFMRSHLDSYEIFFEQLIGAFEKLRFRPLLSMLSDEGKVDANNVTLSKPTISFDLLDKIDIRVGTIEQVSEVSNSDKLVRLTVDFGDRKRNILVGMKKERANPKEIEGKQALFVVNLEPKKMAGELSEGMLFDIGYADGITPVLAMPEKPVPNGRRAG